MSRLSRFFVLLECAFILVPLSLLSAIDVRIKLASVSDGLMYATINPMARMVMSAIAASALVSVWVLSVKYIANGSIGLVQLGRWFEISLFTVAALGSCIGGFASLNGQGFDRLYGLGLGVFVPLAHLLVARQLFVHSQSTRDA